MGLSTEIWGREGWKFIHSVALSYPYKPTEKDKENYLAFFKSLENVLPCSICAENFRKKMEKTPPKLESKIALFNWTVDIHNEVNRQNGKKELTHNEAFITIMYDGIKSQFSKYNDNGLKDAVMKDLKTIAPFMVLSVLFAYVITRKTKN